MLPFGDRATAIFFSSPSHRAEDSFTSKPTRYLHVMSRLQVTAFKLGSGREGPRGGQGGRVGGGGFPLPALAAPKAL